MNPKLRFLPKGSAKSAKRRVTAAEIRREAKLEARRKLLADLHPSRAIPDLPVWVAIISKQAKEHTLGSDLEARTGGFVVIPMYDAKPRRKATVRRPQAVALPLLPRVIFAGYQFVPNWLAIEALPNYAGRLEIIAGVPAYIPAGEVARLRDQSELARLPKAMRGPKVGDMVRVKGLDVVDSIERLDGKYAVLKRMMLGQNVRVELSRVELEQAA